MRKEFQQKLGNINKTQEDFDMAVIKNFDEIVERVKGFPKPMRVIVAAAQDEHTLQAIKHAQEEGIAKPVLVGDKAEINKNLVQRSVWLFRKKIFMMFRM